MTKVFAALTKVRLLVARVHARISKANHARISKANNVNLIHASGLFDLTHYRQQIANETISDRDAVHHYLLEGAARGLDPSPYFGSVWYLNAYADVAKAGINPLVHYIQFGAREGRNPGPMFDTSWYVDQYRDVAASGVNPLAHFLSVGLREGRLPNRLAVNPALAGRLRSLASRMLPSDGIIRERRSFNLAAMGDVADQRGWPIYQTAEPPASSFHEVARDFFDDKTFRLTKYPPSPFVVHADDVVIIGGTRHILVDDKIMIHDETTACVNAPEFNCKLHDARISETGIVSLEVVRRAGNIVNCGVHAMHEYANNYFHLITEVLPRIYVARQDPATEDIPLLINQGLHANFRELLTIVDDGQPAFQLEKSKLYAVAKLYYPSDVSSILDVYVRPRNADDTALHTPIIRRIVDKILHTVGFTEPVKRYRKLYVRRGRRYRGLVNEEEIEAKLRSLDFEICNPEGLSIKEQIRMFREATLVVAPTGAGLTNLVWCQSGAKALVLAAEHPSMPLEIWTQLGDVSECIVNSLQGPRSYKRNDIYAMHDDYSIPLASLEAWFERMRAEPVAAAI
jgi:capsular polysaccharide biosynthesis protein